MVDKKPKVASLLDDMLLQKYYEEWEQPYHHKWRPSLFGYCYRRQYWSRQRSKESNIPSSESLRKFWFGHLGHKMLQDQLPKKFVEVEFETDDECGHTDFISNTRYYYGVDRVIDFKFTWGYGFKKMAKKGYDIEADKEGYCLQATRYAMAFNKPYAEILVFDRGSVKDISFMIKVSDWEDRVNDELMILRNYWKQNRLPPGIPRKSWQCDYCGYKDMCFELDGDKIKRR